MDCNDRGKVSDASQKLSSNTFTDFALQALQQMELVQQISKLHERLVACVDAEAAIASYPNLVASERAIRNEVINELVKALKELKSVEKEMYGPESKTDGASTTYRKAP